jgi:hypothetical protein
MPASSCIEQSKGNNDMLYNPARRLRQFAGLLLLSGSTGCACLNDPFACPGTWKPEHLNEGNLAAMVVDPRHLQQGVGTDASPGVLSAAAVHRLLTDHVKPLPTTNVGPIANSADPPSSGSGGATQ